VAYQISFTAIYNIASDRTCPDYQFEIGRSLKQPPLLTGSQAGVF
jgi:hypothetical protein